MKKTDLHVSAVNTSPMINGIVSYHHSLPRMPFFLFLFFNLTTHLIFLTGAILFGTILRDLSGLLGFNLFRETVCETSENRDLTNSL